MYRSRRGLGDLLVSFPRGYGIAGQCAGGYRVIEPDNPDGGECLTWAAIQARWGSPPPALAPNPATGIPAVDPTTGAFTVPTVTAPVSQQRPGGPVTTYPAPTFKSPTWTPPAPPTGGSGQQQQQTTGGGGNQQSSSGASSGAQDLLDSAMGWVSENKVLAAGIAAGVLLLVMGRGR